MNRRFPAILVATSAILGATLVAAGTAETAGPGTEPRTERQTRLPPVDGPLVMLVGPEFPIQVNVSRAAALMHWLDSLAALQGPGATAGKTVQLHRAEFRQAHGAPDADDNALLTDYVTLRNALARGDGARAVTFSECFLGEIGVDRALSHCSRMLSADERRRFAAIVRHFDRQFEAVWRHGLIPREFLARATASPRRAAVTSFLVDLAGFFGVPAAADPPPRVLLAPVAHGGGTHAQALGRFLLIEVRPGEGLVHEIPPIVHETAHFLDQRVSPSRRQAMRAAAAAHGSSGVRAWRELREALPTALAQGVAAERFHGRHWSIDAPWYHLPEIDRYAKRIFPIVRAALDADRTLDTTLIDTLVRAHPSVRTPDAARPSTPR